MTWTSNNAFASQGLETTEAGNLRVALSEPLTAFGEVRVASPSAIVQFDGVYGLLDNMETETANSGQVTASGGAMLMWLED